MLCCFVKNSYLQSPHYVYYDTLSKLEKKYAINDYRISSNKPWALVNFQNCQVQRLLEDGAD